MNIPGGTSPGFTNGVDDEAAQKKVRTLVHVRRRGPGVGRPPPSDLEWRDALIDSECKFEAAVSHPVVNAALG